MARRKPTKILRPEPAKRKARIHTAPKLTRSEIEKLQAQAAISPISLTLQGRDIAICRLYCRFHQRSRAVADESTEFRAAV